MHLARHQGPLRRGSAFALLALLLIGTALTLSQCQMVSERLTGISFAKANPVNCMSACASAANDSIRAESALHVTNVHACAGDSICLAMEDLRHDAAVERIQTWRKQCQSDCHHQGTGGGGR